MAEIGFGGGEGVMAYVSLGVQWGLRTPKPAPTQPSASETGSLDI
jgi:hypothetical protein